jgi:hypothetical protein
MRLNRKLVFASVFLCLTLGCSDILLQVTPTHIRTYKVASNTLPTGDEVKSVDLQKQIDIDAAKIVKDVFAAVDWSVGKLWDIGTGLLF